MFVASWDGAEIARSPRCILVENCLYFPPESILPGLLTPGQGASQCYWKGGDASYLDIHAGGKINKGGAWTYRQTAPVARPIENWIAFWQGVETRWTGEGAGHPAILDHAVPSVAKALGLGKVHWRPLLEIPGLDREFTGYRIDTPPALVEIFAESGAAGREQLIATGRAHARAVADHSGRLMAVDEPGLGYIAVWGSATPSASALAALRQGLCVSDLGDKPEVLSVR